MKYAYTPKGVCSRKINFEIEDGVVKNVSFTGDATATLKAFLPLLREWKLKKL